MGLPIISVEFKKLASTALSRSIRGMLAIVIQDDTGEWSSKTYAELEEVKSSDYTKDNYKIISRAFLAGPYRVTVVRVGTSGTMDDAKNILKDLAFNWIVALPDSFQSGLVAYVKEINTNRRVRKAKALVHSQASADDMHVVNVANTKVTIKGDGEATEIGKYLPRIGGMLAACPMNQSVTYKVFDDLESVEPVSDIDSSIDSGNLVLFQDDDAIRIARGVNTLQTVTGDLTEDMKKIAIVEAMDLIQEDIIRTFKNYYLGKKKNSADNQGLFVADVLAYLQQLSVEDIIDRNQEIVVEIDVAAMRSAWEEAGTSVVDLSDAQVKKKTFRSYIFVAARAHILDAMEDMKLVFTMA